MLFAKDLPATGMTWAYVAGEIVEFVEEVTKANLAGMVSEACDVYTCTTCAILTSTGINLPVVWTPSAIGWIERTDYYKSLLSGMGMDFKVEYLRYGSNPTKPEKVIKVIQLAKEDQEVNCD